MKKKKVGKTVKKPKAKKKIVATKKPKEKAVRKSVKSKKKPALKEKKGLGKIAGIPEGASLEEVGIITHYFPKVSAAVVKLTKGSLSTGANIYIKGHTSNFTEKVESIQLDHVPIQTGEKGQEIGLKVKSKVREHDAVYKVIP